MRLYSEAAVQEGAVADVLRHFLREASRQTFAYGKTDCLIWMAPWVMRRRGVDPAATLRGSYSTKAEALRIILCAGGMVPLMASLLEPLGIRRAEEPVCGDVSVARGPEGEMGGIVLERMVACLAHPGLFMRPMPIVAAWNL